MSKRFFTIIVACVLSALSAVPSMAQEWLVDPTTYKHATADEEWLKAEALAELKQWTDARKDAILALPDEAQRYDAVVKAVCDFLEYDLKYTQPFISYTLRDGKGVCGDYTVLTKALCEAVGIKCDIVVGEYLNDSHSWNKVTLMGQEYYSDLTSVDAGLPAYKLSSQLWSDHIEEIVTSDMWYGLQGCGRDISENAGALVATPVGSVMCKTPDNRVFYVTEEDEIAFQNNQITVQELLQKYGMN